MNLQQRNYMRGALGRPGMLFVGHMPDGPLPFLLPVIRLEPFTTPP